MPYPNNKVLMNLIYSYDERGVQMKIYRPFYNYVGLPEGNRFFHSYVEEDLNVVLAKEKMLLMFASDDRIKFADDMLIELIEKIVSWRVRVLLPSDTAFVESLGRVCELCASGVDVDKHLAKTKIDAVQVGKELLGKEISKHAAVKAMYVTKQMNLTLMQNEMILGKMSANEKGYAAQKQQGERRIEIYKAEVEKIMGDLGYAQ